jgi:hypothetical protein
VLGPDICSAAVQSYDTGTAHFDDLEFLHIFYEGIDLLAVSGRLDTDGLIGEIDYLRPEDIRCFNDIGMLLLGVPYLNEKELALDTILSGKDDYLLNVIEFSKLRDHLILIVLFGGKRDRDT